MRRGALIVFFALVGCGAPADAGPGPAVQDSAGIRIVTYGGLPDLPTFPLPSAPTFELGVVSGDPMQEFDYLSGATRLADGTVVVADGGASELRAFGPDGSFLWASGGNGEGPGEFRSIGWIRAYGDSLAVSDRSLDRLSIFTTQGGFQRMVRPAPFPGSLSPTVVGIHPGGILTVSFSPLISPQAPEGVHRLPAAVTAFSSDGFLMDTIAVYQGPEWVRTVVGGRGWLAPRDFGVSGVLAVSPGRVAVAETERFEVRFFDPEGRPTQILRVDTPVRPVTPEDIGALRDQRLSEEPDVRRHPFLRQEIEAMPFPEAHPALRGLYLDRSHRLWVREHTLPWEMEGLSYLVFTPEGEILGRVHLPTGHTLLEAGAGYVMVRAVDEMEVQYLRLFEMELEGP